MRIKLGQHDFEAKPLRLGAILRLRLLWGGQPHMAGTAAFAALGMSWPTDAPGYPLRGITLGERSLLDYSDDVIERLALEGLDPDEVAVAAAVLFNALIRQLPSKAAVEEAAGNSSAQTESKSTT